MKPQNAGRERLRPSVLRQALVQAPVLRGLRRRVLPRRWSQSAKVFWRARIEPPAIPPDLAARLREVFDADLNQLGSWLGITLDCANFNAVTAAEAPFLGKGRAQPAAGSVLIRRRCLDATRKTLTSSGRMSLSPAAKPLRIRAATALLSAG